MRNNNFQFHVFLLSIFNIEAQLVGSVRSVLFWAFMLLFSVDTISQSQGINWQRPLGGSSEDAIRSSMNTPDGNILIASETSANNGDIIGAHGLRDVWLCKLTPEGRILWSKTLGSSGQDNFLNIHNSPDGGYILLMQPGGNNGDVTGYKGSTDVFVVKLSSAGVIQWKRCVGGSSSDNYVSSIVQPDGSTLIFGNSFSADGDFPGNHGSADIFVCRIDEQGNIRTVNVYGGADSESFNSVIIKSNGNYLIYGRTLSNNSGQIGVTKGSTDLIMMEISSTGTFLWCKSYGGSRAENPVSIYQTGTNKMILIAGTTSANGDMVGGHGADDVWIGVIDSLGTLLTSQTLGGSLSESVNATFYYAVDSSILIACLTNSSDGHINNYHGATDLWIVKINNQGTVQWSRCLGGSGFEALVTCQLTEAGTFFLASTNSTDGDLTDNHGKTDFWMGLINVSGNLDWQKCLGGSEDDYPRSMLIDSNQIIVGGNINSTDGNVTGMHARSDTIVGDTSTTIRYYSDVWIANVSTSGTLNWQKSLGGFNTEQLQNVFSIGKELYVSASTLSNDGDVFRNHGGVDTWLVRVGPSNTITGKVFIDSNTNGIMEPGEPYLNDAIIESKKSKDNRSTITYNGFFKNEVDTGSYITSILLNLPYYTAVPSNATSSFSDYFNKDSITFALQPIPGKRDLVINALPLSFARPGFNTTYKLFYNNVGTTTISSGEIVFVKDRRLTVVSSNPETSSTNGDTLKWNYTNLAPADTGSIMLQLLVQVPPGANINDTLTSNATIAPVDGDETVEDNTSNMRHLVRGSFDPNNKYENNGGVISPAQVTDREYLNYTIRYQNTGTDTAFTVIIKDTLTSKLDLTSLQMINSSHAYNLSITDGDKLTWRFNNINLPDSNINELDSHGFLAYRIMPKATVAAGDTINNTASIYFDFNMPITTDNARTVVRSKITLPLTLLYFSASLTNEITRLQWTTQGEYDFERFIIQRSTDGKDFENIGTRPSKGIKNGISRYDFSDNLNHFPDDFLYYRLQMIDRNGETKFSPTVSVHVAHGNYSLSVFPNPISKGMAVAAVVSEKKAPAKIRLLDTNSKVLWSKDYELTKGTNHISLRDLSFFRPGVYMIQVVVDSRISTKEILIVK